MSKQIWLHIVSAALLLAAAVGISACSSAPPLVNSSGMEMRMNMVLTDAEENMADGMYKLGVAATPAAADSVLMDLEQRLIAIERNVEYCKGIISASPGEYTETTARMAAVKAMAGRLDKALGQVASTFPDVTASAARVLVRAAAIARKAE